MHDARGDFGPYKLWKLRQEQKLAAAAAAAAAEPAEEVPLSPAPAPVQAPAPRKKFIAVKKLKQVPQPILPAFQSFPAQSQPKQLARPQQHIFSQPQQAVVPQQQAPPPAVIRQAPQALPAPPTFQLQPQTPDFISETTGLSSVSNFALRSWAYTAPTYTAEAQGVNYSYQANL